LIGHDHCASNSENDCCRRAIAGSGFRFQRSCQKPPNNDETLNLVGPLVDLRNFSIAIEALGLDPSNVSRPRSKSLSRGATSRWLPLILPMPMPIL
jgi:hypothetical protein